MKTNLYKSLLLLFVLIWAGSARSQWEKTSWQGVEGVRYMIARGTSLYVLDAAGGLYISQDNGGTWRVNPQLPRLADNPPYPGQIRLAGNYISAQSKDTVFLSSDNGDNWTVGGTGLPVDANISGGRSEYLVAFDYTDSDKVYVSHDGGKNFEATGGRLKLKYAVYFDGLVLCESFDSGIFVSRDLGLTWSQFNEGLDPSEGKVVSIDFARSDSELYITASRHNGGIHRLNKDRTSWIRFTPLLERPEQGTPTHVGLAVVVYGIYLKFVNASGHEIHDITQGLPQFKPEYQDPTSIAADDEYLFVGYKKDGIWRRKISELAVPPNSVSDVNLDKPAETIRIIDLLGRDFSVRGINSIEEAMQVLLPHGFYLLVSPKKHVGRYVE